MWYQFQQRLRYLPRLTAALLLSLDCDARRRLGFKLSGQLVGWERAGDYKTIPAAKIPRTLPAFFRRSPFRFNANTLWSAEHLTRGRVQQAHAQLRRNGFHPEGSLPVAERAELRDYSRSGFDRGHMTPSGDMPDAQSHYDSFTLANMVPQDPKNNRGIWEAIESAVRGLTEQRGELYVITGPLFVGSSVQQINGRVLVPTHIYKLVYDLQRNEGAAYLMKNVDTRDVQQLSVEEIGKMAGFDSRLRLNRTASRCPFRPCAATKNARVATVPDRRGEVMPALFHPMKTKQMYFRCQTSTWKTVWTGSLYSAASI